MRLLPSPARWPRTGVVAVALVASALLAGCTDQALIDRIAQLETSQDRLRASLTELGAPDPQAALALSELNEMIASLEEQILVVAGAVDGVEVDLEGQVLDLDDQVTAAALRTDELRAEVAQLSAALAALTDRVTSLDAQLDAHRGDAFGHSGG